MQMQKDMMGVVVNTTSGFALPRLAIMRMGQTVLACSVTSRIHPQELLTLSKRMKTVTDPTFESFPDLRLATARGLITDLIFGETRHV